MAYWSVRLEIEKATCMLTCLFIGLVLLYGALLHIDSLQRLATSFPLTSLNVL